MNRTTIADLPNEIFLKIFYELSPADVLRAWWNINARFNQLIFAASYQVSLKGRNVTDQELRAIKILRYQVVSLIVTKKWCRLVKEFDHITTLRVIGSTRPFSLTDINARSLSHLVSVKFDLSALNWDDFMRAENYHYAKQMVTCHCYMLSAIPTVTCETLRSVKVLNCENKSLVALLNVAPNLHHLHIGLETPLNLNLGNLRMLRISGPNLANEHPTFTPTPVHEFQGQCYPHLRQLDISFECETTLKWFDQFLSSTPNLTHLSLRISRSYEAFSFAELHRILQERLPDLKQSNLHFYYCCLPKTFDVEQHRKIGPLFRTMKAREFRSGPMTLLCISINWTQPLS